MTNSPTAKGLPDVEDATGQANVKLDLGHGADGPERAVPPSALLPTSAADLSALRDRLVGSAAEGGLLDVAYRTVDVPVGPLLLVATERGLVRVAFEREGFETVLDDLAVTISPRIMSAPRRLDAAAIQLDEYFAGRRRAFDLPLDRTLSTGFRGRVHRSLPGIAYGTTRSYGQVAAELGSPRAVRAVGTACATNPLPVVVPCHRVVRSDGSLGGYLGGLDAKRTLLGVEAAA